MPDMSQGTTLSRPQVGMQKTFKDNSVHGAWGIVWGAVACRRITH